MNTNWEQETQEFHNIIDFYRFAISKAQAADLFYGHGTDNVADDIRSLILGSLHLPWDIDHWVFQATLTSSEKKHLCQQLEKRVNKRIPVPYLLQQAYFCGLSFHVDERVLIPRSPIGELIEQQFVPWVRPEQVTRILDLCTGSGCIAIACCYAFPEAVVDAVDISLDAMAVAVINQKKHHLEDQLTLLHSDCFDQLPHTQYDIIVSNPPYVGNAEMQTLPLEYSHEPAMALEADNNGLAIVAKILAHAHDYLTDSGILVMEVGNSEEALMQAFPELPFTWLEFEKGGQGVFVLTRQQLAAHFAD